MKIVFCAAEAAPFAKVGGLGDVVGSLPKALAALGDEVIVCLPLYGCISAEEYAWVDTGIVLTVDHQDTTHRLTVMETTLPGSDVRVYFFANAQLYGNVSEIYPYWNPAFEVLRFEVLGKATLALLEALRFRPDILHLHDWHTANVATWLAELRETNPFFAHAGTVLSLHNMAYQGILNGRNWLQTGLETCDALVAVSPTYAQEILTSAGGAGLEDVVARQRHKLSGILNGIDMDLFNPLTDPFIPHQYGPQTAEAGKAACKQALQMQVGLTQSARTPLFGMVTRLVEQKGLDLLVALVPQMMGMDAQWVILGAGQKEYEQSLLALNTASSNIRTMVGFNLALGQHIFAGADLFLMPSHFEPCGLGQMIALRYGTLPVVRRTGGLADTVFDVDADPARGNGFVFTDYTPQALLATMERAIAVWCRRDVQWWQRVQRAMTEDRSWDQSARQYQDVYRQVMAHAMQRT